ncbi:Gfo/Idh/MocA family protein [Fimbriiglobus ruber]|uniref:Myo-inositol 2-dehydrogenase n=1 Tax=Fimbriiglobus ruber TaxID=1908690 RepID=A0A225D6Q0_9BACT|nr:Gfo/Idh/MocA family oxidoreductase [Fimbriiglobus ruber]OWK36663.1 Myo-inositol 2-dehydrogenase [Fimbriiglobus ruber]
MPSHPISRRKFLAASALAASAAPFVRARAAGEPTDKVRVAVIGVSGQGAYSLGGVAKEDVVALCDVDESRATAARKQFPSAKFFTDYRKMFDGIAAGIDAVAVCTPDHTHAHAALAAIRRGKHVYCEKPLARTVQEVRLVTAAAAEHKVVTQMGTQIHAGENYRRVVEIVKSGLLGEIKRVHVWCHRRPNAGKKLPAPTPGVTFDTDVWLGPTPQEFFYANHPTWPHFHWRWWWGFGGGTLEDMGCHFMDLAHWALDLTSPTLVKATGSPIPGAENTVPEKLQVEYQYPARGSKPAVHLTWYHGETGPALDGKTTYKGFPDGVLFEGEKGQLVANYSQLQIMPDAFAKDFKAPEHSIPNSVGHHREWLDAIRGHGRPLCQFAYAGPLTESVLLGNASYQSGKELAWDAARGVVTNTKDANAYLECHARKGWELV